MDHTEVSDVELILSRIHRLKASECASLVAALPELSSVPLSAGIFTEILGRNLIKSVRQFEEYAKLLAYMRRMMSYYDIQCVRFGSPEYPLLLAEIYDPPFLLFYRGDISVLGRCCCGIVGTRRMTSEGARSAFTVARTLSASGITVVSGLAIGIDAAAHKGALEGSGATAAVLPGSLDSLLPQQNAPLAVRIIENGGVLVSEYPPGEPMGLYHFPQRNRIISGVSCGVFVAQAPEKSGALITADFAVEQNRSVYLFEPMLRSPQNSGCLHLALDGASVFSVPEELVVAVQNDVIVCMDRQKNISLPPKQQMLFSAGS